MHKNTVAFNQKDRRLYCRFIRRGTMSSKNVQAIVGLPSLFRRLTAMIYDAFLLAACLLAGSATINLAAVLSAKEGSIIEGEIALNAQWKLALFVFSVAIYWAFFCYFWVKSGQTLGMQTWRLRIDNLKSGQTNERISYSQATLRLLGAFLSLICFGLGYLWCFIDKDRQTWHDKLSGSQLVLLEKRKE